MTEMKKINNIELYRRYVSLRLKHINDSKFFIFYMNNKCSVLLRAKKVGHQRQWVVCIRISICLYYMFVFFYLIESMYFYLSLIQVKAFANGLRI
jgi:hypothetical protein